MAYFENEIDDCNAFSEFKAENQIFTATVDRLADGAIELINVRRKEGDRVVENLRITGKQADLLEEICKLDSSMETIAFMADIEFKNIRIAKYIKLED